MTNESNVASAKLAANRANAQKSTGPRTAAGKAASRMNGLRHGLRAELVVVPQLEDASEWEIHRAAVLDSLAPTTYLEALLADRASLATWRLQRATRYERAILTQAQSDAEKKVFDSLYLYDDGEAVKSLETATRHVSHYRDAIAAIEQLHRSNPREEIENGYVFDLIKRTAARMSGIPLVAFRADHGLEWEDLPEDVYSEPERKNDYPNFGELRELLEAIAKHDARGDEDNLDVPQRTLRELRYRLHIAERNEAKLAEAIAKEREKHALPIAFAGHDHRHDELLARYETSAERSLERALAGLLLLRTGLASVGKRRKTGGSDYRGSGKGRPLGTTRPAKVERRALPAPQE